MRTSKPRTLTSRSGAATSLVLLLPLSACSILDFGGVPVDHQTLQGEWASSEIPGSISEISWEWVAEGYSGDLEVTALPQGVVARMSQGVVALDGTTGEERWSFTVQDENVRVLTDVSSTGERVHVLYPEEISEEQIEEGEKTTWRRVVLNGNDGEIIGEWDEDIRHDSAESGAFDEPGPFDIGIAGDAGVFRLEEGDRLSGAMFSEEDGSQLWRTADLFTCEGSRVSSADSPVMFSGAVVIKAGCDSGEAELISLDPESGDVLWHLEGEDSAFLAPEQRSIRRAGESLPIYPSRGIEHEEELFGEQYMFDPITGDIIGEGLEIIEEKDKYLARTVENGFLVSTRVRGDDFVGYELRRFDGETLATEARAIETSSAGSYVLALEEAVVKLELENPETPISVAPWGGGRTRVIDLPEPVGGLLHFYARPPEGSLEAVPGAVVLVDRGKADEEGVKVIGFQ